MDNLIDLPLQEEFGFTQQISQVPSITNDEFLSAIFPWELPTPHHEIDFPGGTDDLAQDLSVGSVAVITELTDQVDQEELPQPPPRRTRRVLGPVSGNNKTGKTGKLKCEHCRRRRSQCIYEDVSQPCQLCKERGWECRKVPGPKAAARNNAIILSSASAASSIRHLSLISDTNLTDTENMYLRFIYKEYWADFRCYGFHIIVMQHIWAGYGLASSNQALLYATLCTARALYDHVIERKPREIDPYFMSRFLAALQDAIRKDEITECHLFAVGLITQLYINPSREFWIHLQGFIGILERLLHRQEKATSLELERLSAPLYAFMLNGLAEQFSSTRMTCVQEALFLRYKAFVTLGRMTVPSVGTTDERILSKIPIQFWSCVHLQRPYDWNDVWQACLSIHMRFSIEFSVYCGYYHQLELGLKGDEESELLNAMELDFEKVLILPCVQEFLEYFNSEEGGLQYIQTELDKGTLTSVTPVFDLIHVWGSVTLLFHLRRNTKEIGGLPLLGTMRKVLEICRCYGRNVWYWYIRILGIFSALICPAFAGDCEEVNELRMNFHSALVEHKLRRIGALESHSSDLEDGSKQDDEIATMEMETMEDFSSDADGSDDMLETEMGGNLRSLYESLDDASDKFKPLCQERTRSAVIEFLQENLEWFM